MFGWLHRSSAITFDAGRSTVRACQLRGAAGRYSLCDQIRVELPGADPASRMPELGRLVRTIEQGDFDGIDVGLVVDPPLVQFHTLKLPEPLFRAHRQQACDALAWEIARETRADPAQLEVRFWRLPPGHRGGLNVIAATMLQGAAAEMFGAFAQRRLRLRSINAASCALVRAALLVHAPEPDDVWGILDLGSAQSTLTVVLGRIPVYVRSLSFRSADLTRRISEAFDLSAEEAEALKRQHGLTPSDRGVRQESGTSLITDKEIARVVFAVARQPIEALTREVIQCFSYVIESYPNAHADRLLLAGGGAALTGLDQLLEDLLGLPTEVLQRDGAQPPAREAHGLSVSPANAAVVGAALLDLETM